MRINSGRKGARSRNDFLNQRNRNREERERQRNRNSASVVIQSSFRSFSVRQVLYRQLRNRARILLTEIQKEKKKSKEIDLNKLQKVISIIVFTGRMGVDEEIMSSRVRKNYSF